MSTKDQDPFQTLRSCAAYVEENGQPAMAGRLLKEIDRAEILLNDERALCARLVAACVDMDSSVRVVWGNRIRSIPAQWRGPLLSMRAAIAKAVGK